MIQLNASQNTNGLSCVRAIETDARMETKADLFYHV